MHRGARKWPFSTGCQLWADTSHFFFQIFLAFEAFLKVFAFFLKILFSKGGPKGVRASNGGQNFMKKKPSKPHCSDFR